MYSPREAACQWKFLAMFKGKKALVVGRLATAQDFQRKARFYVDFVRGGTQPASMRCRKPREWILNSVNTLGVTEE
jgi:hypothetical protein